MEERKIDETNESLSRRNFMAKTGILTAGAALAGAFLGSLLVSNEAEAVTTMPIPYKKLDINKVRRRGYDAYFQGGCCYGAAKALLDSLREVSGPTSQWHNIPEDMFKYGAGGINGWGTLCGALNGSLYILNLATASYSGLGNELIKWYTKFPFPSTKHELYAKVKNQRKTICHSPLCHVSVSIWCTETGFGVNSNEKKDRCAKLTGDTAAKAAELLNKLLTKTGFKPAEKFAAATNFCMTCHAQGNTNNPKLDINSKYGNLDNEQGKMDCGECHDNEHDHKSTPEFNSDCSGCHK